MSATAQATATPTTTDPVQRWLERRSAKAASPRRHKRQRPKTGQSGSRSVLRDSIKAINRANSQHSTGPRTEAGKQRSSLNALRHGLTAASPVLPSEDPAAYAAHRSRFFDEYQPATPTESQLVQELVDTSWRLNRIPLLEADALARAVPPADPAEEIAFDIVDAHRLIANLGIQSQRLSRQFQKSLATLRDIQADRTERERRSLKDAAALLELHKHKGIPWEPSDHGFVFSKDRVERFAERAIRLNEARHIEHVRFHSSNFDIIPFAPTRAHPTMRLSQQ